jgi:drug/metabolite transporter (DMT)-like permease
MIVYLKRLLSVVFFRQRQTVLQGVGILLSVTAAAVCLLGPAFGAGMTGAIGSYPPAAWGRLGCLAVFVTVLGFLWDCEGIRATSVTTASALITFVPVSAILMACVILREPATHSLLSGGVLLTGDFLLTSRFARDEIAMRTASAGLSAGQHAGVQAISSSLR